MRVGAFGFVALWACGGSTATSDSHPSDTPVFSPDPSAESAAESPADSPMDTEPPVDTEPPPPEPVSVLALGDAGTGGTGQAEVAAAIAAWCVDHPCDFVIGLGDNIYDSGVSGVDDTQFDTKFEQPYSAVDLPFYMSIGNHDYVGNEQAQVDYTNLSGKWRMPDLYYGFQVSNVGFFALDTVGAGDTQQLEVIHALESSQAAWKVVYGHYPLRSNGEHGDATGSSETWLQTVLCNRADVYLSGHDHGLQWLTDECGVALIVSGGGGAGIYDTTVESNTIFAAETYGFVALTFDGDTVRVQFVDEDGAVLHDASRSRTALTHGCGDDEFCDQACEADPDCGGLDCTADGACELQCSDDPDCWGSCSCDYYPGICEAVEVDTTVKCGCDPACGGDAQACAEDGHCDSWCPVGLDDDC